MFDIKLSTPYKIVIRMFESMFQFACDCEPNISIKTDFKSKQISWVSQFSKIVISRNKYS